jgi:adenylate cyclase
MSAQQSEAAETTGDPYPRDRGQPAEVFAERIEQMLLGGPRRYTRCEVAEAAGVSPERSGAIWLALGFADVAEDARVFTDGDIEAARTWTMLVDGAGIPPDEELSHLRAIGQTFSRLADWQVREIVARVGQLTEAEADERERAARAAELTEVLLPVVETLQSYAWRRHLVAAAGRFWSGSPGELPVTTMIVGFADIVGYTSTVRHTDINELSALLESFEENASETIVRHHGRVVKTVGDEVMFVADTPRDAAEIGLLLSDPGRVSRRLPQLRVGIAQGQVLSRFGDVYGPAVNVASRLTSLAKPGTVLVDRELAKVLRDEPGYRLHGRRPAAVRGYHHLRSWSLHRGAARAEAPDGLVYPPVLGA